MHRTSNAFNVLQATAVIAGFAVILWSLGLPAIRFAEAASVTDFSATLSDSAPGASANYTITFVTPTGMSAGDTLTLDFETGEFGNIASLAAEDLDLTINGSDQDLVDGAAAGTDWGIVTGTNSIDIESGSVVIASSATVTIAIGTNASFATTGDTQITNPSAVRSYEINLTLGSTDTGETRVAVVDSVTVSAAVDTVFNFTVSGTSAGTAYNGIGADTTSIVTTATTVPFGVLSPDTASTAAQQLEVETNAANGFVVTVQVDQQLTSSNGAVIDGFRDGGFDATPVPWAPPNVTVGQLNTYGHWAITSNDTSLTAGLSDLYTGGNTYVSASTTPVEVFRHDGPANSSSPAGEGSAQVGFKIEVTSLQEAADDYTATLTYVATPVF